MHGLVDDPISQTIIRGFCDSSRIVAAVCHGPAALLEIPLADGTLLIRCKRITGFSEQEEIKVEMTKNVPFFLERALDTASNGFYEKASEPMRKKVVVAANGRLLTGQNPASAYALAVEILKTFHGSRMNSQ